MKSKIILGALFLLTVTITGCWDQKIIEKKIFIVELGLESALGPEILFTMGASQLNTQGRQYNELFTTQANLIREGMKHGDLLAGGDIEIGKIQHVLFSEELAGQGIHRLLEVFERNPLLPLQSSLVVVEGSPNELLRKLITLKDKPQPTFYLEQLIKRSANQSYLLKTSVGDFEVAYFAPGIDPLLPMIKQVEGGIAVTGVALFAKDRMVGKLDSQQTALLLAMMNQLRQTELFFKSMQWTEKGEELKKGIAVSITKAHRKLVFKIQGNQPPELKIVLRFKGDLLEYRWDHLNDKKKLTEIKKKLAAEIKNSCLQVLQYTQRVGSDPIGFGDLIRAKYNSYWKTINWMRAYRDAKMAVDVQFELVHYGLIK